MHQKSTLIWCGFCHAPLSTLIFTLILTTISFSLQAQEKQQEKEFRGNEASAILTGSNFIKQDVTTDFPRFARLETSNQPTRDAFFNWLDSEIRTEGNLGFKFLKTYSDQYGTEHQRYQQTYDGIPIQGKIYILHIKNGLVTSFNGHAMSEAEKTGSVNPIPEATALQMALNAIGAKKYRWEDPKEEAFLKRHMKNEQATYYPKGELVYIPKANNQIRMAWQFEVREVNYRLDQRIYIDASTGEKIKSYPITYECDGGSASTTWHGTQTISTDLDGSDYILYDDCTGSHDATMRTINDLTGNDYTDADNAWTETAVRGFATTHFYLHETHDYYEDVHSWDSYDDSGGDIVARHRDTLSNAFYSGGGVMVFGNGNSFGGNPDVFYNTLDVVGHEFTHGVIDNTADLVYQGEPGALNESFADILGEAVERRTENNQNIDWLHREDYTNGENRSFINPKAKGDPDTYNGDNWASTCNACADNGGVHTNSGVQNHWFYLLSDGGTGTNDNNDDYDVSGIGFVKARTIAFANLSSYLGVNSDYADARTGAIMAAEDIYGECSAEVKAVMDAWYAVGVGDPFLNVDAQVTSDFNGRDIRCFGESNGELTATASDGTAPYNYDWSDGQNSAIATGLSSGTYQVTVTDADGCEAASEATLEDPPLLTASLSVISDYNGWPISCAGACDGILQANASGGTAPYGYKWGAFSDNQATQQATDLCAGTHHVTITDANNCIAFAQVTIDEPPPLEVDAGPNQTIFFYDLSMACTSLMASGEAGGVPPYTYSWSSGGNSAGEDVCLETVEDTVTVVTYYITLSDANGCTVVDSVNVCYVDIRCTTGKGQTKVRICHFPPGNTGNFITLCVSLNSLETHLAHGDHVAQCGFVSPCDEGALPKLNLAAVFRGEEHMLEAFPNPFSQSTTIRFIVYEDTEVSINVYDLFGKEVRKLFMGSAKAGRITDIEFVADAMPPGIYLARMQTAAGEIITRKLILGGQ